MREETNEPEQAGPEKSADAADDGVAVPVRGRRGRVVARSPGGSSPVLVVALVMAAGASVGLVLTFMKDNTIYVKPADELVKNQAKFVGRSVRVEGNLVHGSLVHKESPCEYTFTITKNDVNVPVKYEGCVVPDTFRDVPGM